MTIQVNSIGSYQGQRVDETKLTSDTGTEVCIMNWGCVVRDWRVPTRQTKRSIVLGFDDFEPYPEYSPYFGAVVGRVANRIGGASFELDGKQYTLDANEGKNTLHGGAEGIARRVWQMQTDTTSNSAKFEIDSVDADMGFPGAVHFEATYSLVGNKLSLTLLGVPDRPTPISLVQHHYFNLGVSDNVLDHTVHMPFSENRTVLDTQSIATGEILPVQDTPFDFTSPRTLRDANQDPIIYDLNYVLAERDQSAPIAIATGEDKALTLKLWSDRPGLQFYNGAWTNVPKIGSGNRHLTPYSGLCFEDQMFPNAVNHPQFPSIICTPDNPYRHRCEIDVSEEV